MLLYTRLLTVLITIAAIPNIDKLACRAQKRIPIKKAPWQVSLLNMGHIECGGAIYSEWIVITAASCISAPFRRITAIRAGSSEWTGGGQLRTPAEKLAHPSYNFSYQYYDIAIIKVQKRFAFNNQVSAINLATWTLPNGAKVSITGWDDLEKNKDDPNHLHIATLNIIQCNLALYHEWFITEDVICAGGYDDDACGGDIGGPLVRDGLLFGIINWSNECGYDNFNYPLVAASIPYFYNWIVNTASEISPWTG